MTTYHRSSESNVHRNNQRQMPGEEREKAEKNIAIGKKTVIKKAK